MRSKFVDLVKLSNLCARLKHGARSFICCGDCELNSGMKWKWLTDFYSAHYFLIHVFESLCFLKYIFSSPELKAFKVSFSNRPLSGVRLSICL